MEVRVINDGLIKRGNSAYLWKKRKENVDSIEAQKKIYVFDYILHLNSLQGFIKHSLSLQSGNNGTMNKFL